MTGWVFAYACDAWLSIKMSWSSDSVSLWQMQKLFKTFDVDGDEKISRDDFITCLGRFPFLIAFFAAPINGEVYIEIVWMCMQWRVRVKAGAARRRQGDPPFMQWDTHYGSSILKPKTTIFFGCIKWLTSIVQQFCLVSSFKLLFIITKPDFAYGMEVEHPSNWVQHRNRL